MAFSDSTDLGQILTQKERLRISHYQSCEPLKMSSSNSDLLLFIGVLLLIMKMQAELTFTYYICLVCWFNFPKFTAALGAWQVSKSGQNGIQVHGFSS